MERPTHTHTPQHTRGEPCNSTLKLVISISHTCFVYPSLSLPLILLLLFTTFVLDSYLLFETSQDGSALVTDPITISLVVFVRDLLLSTSRFLLTSTLMIPKSLWANLVFGKCIALSRFECCFIRHSTQKGRSIKQREPLTDVVSSFGTQVSLPLPLSLLIADFMHHSFSYTKNQIKQNQIANEDVVCTIIDTNKYSKKKKTTKNDFPSPTISGRHSNSMTSPSHPTHA